MPTTHLPLQIMYEQQLLPASDSLSQEQMMLPQHQEEQQQSDFEYAKDNTLPLSNVMGRREEANGQLKEPIENDEYEADDQQRPRKRGKQFSKRSNGSNGVGRGGDNDDSLPDENGDETDIEDDDDEEDDDALVLFNF